MAGIDAVSGNTLDELADIRQSVARIVTTPIGSRVMRRTFGSHLFDLVDAPGSPLGAMRVIAAAADGIARWEKRVVMKSGRLTVGLDGRATLSTVLAVRASGLTITADVAVGGPRK